MDKLERNEKGDVQFDFKPIDWAQVRRSEYTYVFHYYDADKKMYLPYFKSIDSTDGTERERFFFEKQLYPMPDTPPYDFYIKYYNHLLALRVEFFKEVFEERAFIDGHQPSHKYSSVQLPKALYDEILNCVNDYGLLQIKDLIFEVIAIAQNKYIEEIAFWEQPEMQKIITSAEKETEKVINIIEKVDEKAWIRGDTTKPPSKLLHINFVFNDGSIQLKHPWLAKEFIDHFKQYYDNLQNRNWRLDLSAYPSYFEKNIKDQEFKYQLAKSYYNLLTQTKFFDVTKAKYPNNLMLCIARLLEFCLIPVGSEDTDEIKIKKIRNWLKRRDLLPAITYAEVPVNIEKLSKYFDSEFIEIIEDTKRADALSIAVSIAKRFNIQHQLADLAHIAQALKEYRFFIGHQVTGALQQCQTFPELESYRKLINAALQKEKITSLKFKIEGDEKEYELTQTLPLYLIEEAVKEYSQNQQIEISTDIIPTKVNKEGNGYKIEKATVYFNHVCSKYIWS